MTQSDMSLSSRARWYENLSLSSRARWYATFIDCLNRSRRHKLRNEFHSVERIACGNKCIFAFSVDEYKEMLRFLRAHQYKKVRVMIAAKTLEML